ncbi:MAG TPA: VOC family protein [Candidatus Limnocylindrales bacterium]|nr:VOC family protein [Candidatus Limnocylindrales bacterium]
MKEAKKLKIARGVEPIPKGFHTITPCLMVRGADRAIEFYKKAFGAEVLDRMTGPDGKSVLHSQLRIGDSFFFLGDEMPGMGGGAGEEGGTCSSLHLYVEDVDAAFNRAIAAGAQVRMPVADMFWGDRYGKVVDPFGIEWGIGTRKEELSPDEIRRGAEQFFRKMGGSQG